MALSSISLNYFSKTISNKFNASHSNEFPRICAISATTTITCSRETIINEERNCKRRLLLLGVSTLMATSMPASSIFAEEVPKNYRAFIDNSDGYSYYYPSDWRDFDFRAHDSAFKDRYLQLQNVRVRFLPTDKKDIHDMGPMEEVVTHLVTHVYAAPNQEAVIFDMKERSENGKNYYTFEYGLSSRNFATTSFATIAVANERFYTLTVAANERRWKRFRNKLKVVADSFKVFDI